MFGSELFQGHGRPEPRSLSNSKKILVVTTTFPRHEGDDQPRFVLDLCNALSDKFEQLVLAPSGPGCDSVGKVEGIPVRRFRYFFRRAETIAYGSGILANLRARPFRWLLLPFFFLGMVIAIRKALRQFRPDIVHAHWWMPAGVATRIAIATTSGEHKLLVTCHGSDYFVLGERFPRLRRWLFARSDAIAMVSTAMREHAIVRGLPANKMHVAPMGVDLQGCFVPGDDTIRHGVIFVGRLVEGKGVDDLLTAWSNTSQAVQSQGMAIIGDGNYRVALQALSKSLGTEQSVTFPGAISHDELPSHFQRAVLLVFPSAGQEGLGLVAIEAMGCGCPVLASDVGSLQDVIIEGQTGFVYPMGDTTTLAQRIEELVPATKRRTEIAARGGKAVRSRFDWSVVGQTYVVLFDSLLATDESARH
jgi:glycosyltransferase involved in cell wall biosynthesis